MARMLESEEAARRLGVKLTTLYAYVSRGLIPAYRAADGKRSLFEVDDVEQLARRARGGRRVETRLATITTAVTQLREVEGPAYRGQLAIDLVDRPYEEVAELLWGADAVVAQDWSPLDLGPAPALGNSDLLRWVVLMAGSADPLRADLRPEAIARVARRLISTMVAYLDGPPRIGSPSIAEMLAVKLSDNARPELTRALNAALVLLADHELATSTVAVRVAASTHADLYDALLSGLATLAGPLHGGASQLAFNLLVDAARLGPQRALDETLRWQRRLPGFGHTVYKDGDPRFFGLLPLFEEMAAPAQRELVGAMVALAADRQIPPPNVDLILAALSYAAPMAADAGRTIFAVARVAGWTAHYLEELAERPLRFRARAIYASSSGSRSVGDDDG